MIGPFFAVDYQVHSFRSHDGRASIHEHCERALALGLDEIGFSEHKDFDPSDPVVAHFNYNEYTAEIERARYEFRGALTVRKGVEVDYQRWFEPAIRDYLDNHTFDFVIGSVHYIDRAMLMTPEYLNGRSRELAYRDYFEALSNSVESGLIDILGHMEYINRRGIAVCGDYDPSPYRGNVCRLFEAMLSQGVALEINTAGLRQGVGAMYPCAEHIRLFSEMGGGLLSIGSDAHHPDELASDYNLAAAQAIEAGFTKLAIWENRTPELRPLVRAT